MTQEPASKKPKYQEGQVLSINYTPEGPVRVVWRDDKQVVVGPEPEINPDVPGGLSDKDFRTLFGFCQIGKHLLTGDRKLPVMVQEAEQVLPKSDLKKLARKGLLTIETLVIVNDNGKKQSYAFCWLTNKGLGVKLQIEEARGLKEEGTQTVEAPEVPATA